MRPGYRFLMSVNYGELVPRGDFLGRPRGSGDGM